MIGWLLERLFIDRKGRAGRRRARRLQQRATDVRAAAGGVEAESERTPATDPEREALINNAMTIFRRRRAEYEKLDDDVRARIDRAANKAFGDNDT
ncbi:MAG: hypothetical protein WD767_20000 [Alphaproteobacteria bacterium]